MLTKTTAVLAAALFVGTASAALGNDNTANTDGGGGYDIGPLGQCFVPPDCGQVRGSREYRSGPYGFAYVPDHRYHHRRVLHQAR